MKMFDLLFKSFGPQHWWPGETELEIMVGAILTQNTSWKNVEKAIDNLKKKEILSLSALNSISQIELSNAIRPAGYYNIKARRLKNLTAFIHDHYDSNLSRMAEYETNSLRESLLSINGIGPETADSILLYVFNRPIFVIDTYTHRILRRHGIVDGEISYYDLQAIFMDNLSPDPFLFNEFHALIVKTGKEYCKKNPDCTHCPLNHWGPLPLS
ncbi:MAG: endonuclease III domain-containing protein [Deltaproteobacteria bacterium]|nr:endonuclease III domain-containing protein [Deltaproteobacteria bacterium]